MKSSLLLLILAFVVFGVSAQTDSLKNLEEVVITGQYTPQSLRNSVYNVKVISNQMIKLRGATELKTILSNELGLRFSNDPATGISDPMLMGMQGASIKVLLDGVPMMDRGTAKESLGQIDINSIDRIEIVEGPMSVVYGTDAMAGVINIITKKGMANSLTVTARIQEESAGSEYAAFTKSGTHNGNLGIDWQKNGWHLAASGSRNNFGGWQGNNAGRAKEWLPKEQWLGSATAGFKRNKLDVWYRFNGTDETLNYLGNVNVLLNPPLAADKKYFSKRWFHQAQGDLKVNDRFSVNAAASYTDYSRRTQSTNLDLNSGKETLSPEQGGQDKDAFQSTFFRGTALYKISSAVTLQPGIEFNNNKGSGDRITGNPVINDYAFFLSSQIDLGSKVQIRPGFRLVRNSVYDAPPFIPSLNARVKVDEQIDLRFAYARGFRAPILRELYFTFHDASHDIEGNENLKAEHSDSFNGSVSWSMKKTAAVRFNSILSGFYNNYKNRIDIGLDASVSNSNVYLNIATFKTKGGELNNTLNWKNLQATLGFAYIGRYNLLSEEAGEVGTSPDFTWSPEVNANISYLLPKIGTNIGLFYKYTGRKDDYAVSTDLSSGATSAQLVRVSAFHMADLTLNKSINKIINLNAGVRNLFDVTRLRNTGGSTEAHGTGDSSPIGFGRSFFVGLSLQWSKNN